MLSEQRPGFEEAQKFLAQNTNPGDIVLTHNNTLGLNVGLPNVSVVLYFDDFMNDPTVRQEIEALGFREAMNKYQVRYFVTTDREVSYYKFANFFTQEELETNFSRRTDQVRAKIYDDIEYFSDMSERQQLVEEYSIPEKFILVHSSERFRVYEFAN